VEKLLDHHAQKDIKTNEGLTALDIARKEHRQEIADMIMYWNENEQLRTEVCILSKDGKISSLFPPALGETTNCSVTKI
jgi:ankyrin repeat protein